LGAPVPRFAHLPVVAEPGSKNKLSKRKLSQYLKQKDFAELMERGLKVCRNLGIKPEPDLFNPVVVGFYELVGFLPEAILNYIALLGWSLDDRTEQLTREELIQHFSLERVNRAPASFDADKLMSFQMRWMLAMPVSERARLCLQYLVRAGLVRDTVEALKTVAQIVAAAGDRIKVAGDILDYADFFLPDDQLARDQAASRRELGRPAARELVRRFRNRLATVEPFDAPTIERLMQDFISGEGIKLGQVIHALRVAVTGRTVGFGMFDTLAILGRERCLRRIDQALEKEYDDE
ncbi:MAG: glutamate--tRNA ligase family protein, partial [candidate division WOR-3 bacterium]